MPNANHGGLRTPRDPVHDGDPGAGLQEERSRGRGGRVGSSPPAAVLASANRPTGGNSASQTVPAANPPFRTLNILINLTVLAGGTTPTVTASIQWSDDGTTWYDVDGGTDTFTALNAVKAVVKSVTIKAPYWRLVTGTTGVPTTATYGASARYLP